MTCNHNNPIFTLTPELIHYGKSTCGTCGRFIRWEPNPETLKRVKENGLKVEYLKGCKLNDWERGFILSVEKQGRLTPTQQCKLDEVAQRYDYPIPSPENG